MSTSSLVVLISVTAYCAVSVVFDLRSGKIPNIITLTGLAAGLLVSCALGGRGALAGSLFGAAIGLAILLAPFLLHIVGAGDVKFLAAAGSIVGWRLLLPSFLAGAALGGAIGFVMLMARDRSVARFSQRIVLWHAGSWRACPPAAGPVKGCPTEPRLAYAVPLSIGLVAVTSIQMFLR